MEKLNHREKTKTRICKRGLVIESCSGCVFEALHWYREQMKRLEKENKKGEDTTNGHSPNRC